MLFGNDLTHQERTKLIEMLAEVNRRAAEVNRIDPRFQLRRHQHALVSNLARYAHGSLSDVNSHGAMVAEALPGGGKSLLGVMCASSLVGAGIYKRALWVTPRKNLVYQAKDDVRQWPQVGATQDNIEWAKAAVFNPGNILAREVEGGIDEINLGRSEGGREYVLGLASYQLISTNPARFLRWVSQAPTFLILDEAQLLYGYDDMLGEESPKDSCWREKMCDIVEAARKSRAASWFLLMSGRLSRADRSTVPWVDYGPGVPPTQDPERMYPKAHIVYDLADAQADQSHVTIDFDFYNGQSKFACNDEVVEQELRLGSSRHYGNLIRAWLSDKRVWQTVIDDMLQSISKYNESVGCQSRWIVIAHSIDQADEYAAYLSSVKQKPLCIHQQKTEMFVRNELRAFRRRERGYTGIVSVEMAYLGLNVPDLSHMAYMHDIRTDEWLWQAIHRVTRNDYKSSVPYKDQIARILCPNDPKMKAVAEKFLELQKASATAGRAKASAGSGSTAGQPREQAKVQYIEGSILGREFQTQGRIVPNSNLVDRVLRTVPDLHDRTREAAARIIDGVIQAHTASSREAGCDDFEECDDPSPPTAEATKQADAHADQGGVHEDDVADTLAKDYITPLADQLAAIRAKGTGAPPDYEGVRSQIKQIFGKSYRKIARNTNRRAMNPGEMRKVIQWLHQAIEANGEKPCRRYDHV